MHQRDAVLATNGFIQHKHFLEVVFTSRASFTSTACGIPQAQCEQASRRDAVLRQIIVTFVEVANSLAIQHFLVEQQRAIRLEHKHPSRWLIRNHHQLVVFDQAIFDAGI